MTLLHRRITLASLLWAATTIAALCLEMHFYKLGITIFVMSAATLCLAPLITEE